MTADSRNEVELLLTAAEAFPAFERAVLGAKSRVACGFRVFDPLTQLRSDEGREIGEDWFDLILHLLGRGVAVDILLTDFDAIVAPDMHLLTWSSLRKFAAITELSGPDAPFRVMPGLHPAQISPTMRTVLYPLVRSELSGVSDWLNGLPEDERAAVFRDMPGIHEWLKLEGGTVVCYNRAVPPLYPVTHHQKIAVIDGETLYVGGLDLNPRRYDTLNHRRPANETWHDVQAVVRGPAAQAAERHLDCLWSVLKGKADPQPPDTGFIATISAANEGKLLTVGPRPIAKQIFDETVARVGRARQTIYLETQFFRDTRLADAIAAAGRENDALEFVLILPAAPEVVAFEERDKIDARFGEHLQVICIDTVLSAFGERAAILSPAQRRTAPPETEGGPRAVFHQAPLVYVHAKLSIFDEDAVIVSSANLNGRSLHWDTEAGIVHEDSDFAAHVRKRAFAHWLPGLDMGEGPGLAGRMRAQAELDKTRQPENRAGFLLPYDLDAARSFGMPLPGVPQEMV
ncbi:phospholipase [Palleronia sediminis]|uniref:Phospholipase D n=1 Tax=Palleronia sediminis TaxID=2547833 RepID=A0A4R6ADB2_9RHOB|nr:phospholipase D family protein [Palleronia sediminis]TDL79386.1 phospholipase [Palleronia sediminis]